VGLNQRIVADAELQHLQRVVELKKQLITELQAVADARRARGVTDCGPLESADYEAIVLAGYQRALDNRKRELAAAAAAAGAL
jgi:hypothetical protein